MILYWFNQGLKAPSIAKALEEERLGCLRCGIAKFLKVYQATGSIARQPGSGRLSKITPEMKHIVEEQMRLDDETTACQLHCLLVEKGYMISLRTILWCRTSLGWTFRGSAYCQLIREANKTKRLTWAQQHLHSSFEDVIWSDESTVQMESSPFCLSKTWRGNTSQAKVRHFNIHKCTFTASLPIVYIVHDSSRPCLIWMGL